MNEERQEENRFLVLFLLLDYNLATDGPQGMTRPPKTKIQTSSVISPFSISFH